MYWYWSAAGIMGRRPGNARHLYLAGYHVNVLIVSEGSRRPKGDAEINLNALLELEKNQAGSLSDKSLMSLKIHWLEEEKELSTAQNLLKQTHLIVDALFGTGLDRPVKGLNKAIIDESIVLYTLNKAGKKTA